MLNKLKSLFQRQPIPQTGTSESVHQPSESKSRKPRSKSAKPKSQIKCAELNLKEQATAAGEPWVNIVRVELDPKNVNSGEFTLDWNDKFVLNLIRAGYKIRPDDTESDIVDRWFQTVCRNVALEIYEQTNADPARRTDSDLRQVQRRDLGDGRSEIS